jgi:hypothetical protein
MNLHSLHEPPPQWLGEALERFEARFRYPLGADLRFRISHGRSYLPFFQAMGEATVWVAERDGEVLGTLAAGIRMLRLPDGEARRVAYLGDLKVAPDGRAGRALALLQRTATTELTTQGVQSAYSVVMGGTSRTPVRYTGRLGTPSFTELGDITILKVPSVDARMTADRVSVAKGEEVEAVHASLVHGCAFLEAGRPVLRSLMTPVPLLQDRGEAGGVVEDTRRGKRLWLDGGDELLAAHLSRFAYASIEAGAALVREAMVVAANAGYPALFVAVPAQDAAAFAGALRDVRLHLAPAKIYGCGISSTHPWRVDTSEI